jgi:hypothetical protein
MWISSLDRGIGPKNSLMARRAFDHRIGAEVTL